MSDLDTQVALQQLLADLQAASFVAHRDATAALPAIQVFGDEAALEWLRAAQRLFQHDRDAGKPFMREGAAAAQAAGEVLWWTRVAVRFTQWRGSWKAVEGFMQQLPAAVALLGNAGAKRWAEIGLAWCERHLDSGVAYFRTPVSALAGRAGVAGIEAVLAPADELFKRRVALSTYLPGAVRVRDLLGAEAIDAWAKKGTDILQAGRLRGEAYFRLESPESIAVLLEQLPGFRLPEHQRLLYLVVRAWFERDVDFQESGWSPDRGRAFIETDARTLFIPAAMPSREEALVAVVHAVGHLVFHSYERRYIEQLFRELGLAHPPLDDASRMTWRPLFAHFGDDLLRFQAIFDACEDLRVDVALDRCVPNHLRRLLALSQSQAPRDGSAAQYWDFARGMLRGALATAPLDARLTRLLEPTATVVDAFRVARELHADTALPPLADLAARDAALLPARAPNAARPVYPRGDLDAAEFGTGTFDRDDPLKHEDIQPNPEHKVTPKSAQGDDPDFDIPPEDTSGSGGRVGVGIPQPAHVIGYARGAAHSEQGVPYPEWDYRDARFKRQWTFVQERALSERDAAEAERLLAAHAAHLRRLKRAIQAQKPVRPAPRRRQLEGDELDLEATLDYVVERRAGMSPRPAVYRRRLLATRDTAVTLLADLSTSIMQRLPHGDGRIVDRLRAGMLLFAEALEEVGDPYALAGFASKNRDHVSYYPIKEFDQRLRADMRATLGGLSGRLATRMGAAIRHAVARFERASSQRRLLLILSDGRPADYDDGGDERYLHEDTRMAVKEAADAGVHAFCITLDPAGGAYLPQIFGAGHYLVVDDMDALPRKLPEVYLRLRR